jgi:hypothetical protein
MTTHTRAIPGPNIASWTGESLSEKEKDHFWHRPNHEDDMLMPKEMIYG